MSERTEKSTTPTALGRVHEKLDHLGALITAPIAVLRDADGKVTGHQRIIPATPIDARPLTLDEALEEVAEVFHWGICFHEAGHCVAGMALGLKPEFAHVKTGQGYHGGAKLTHGGSKPYDPKTFPWMKYSAMIAGGAVAEFKFLRDFNVDFDPEVISAGSNEDRDRVVRNITIGMQLAGDAASQAVTQIYGQARSLLKSNWHRVMSIAYALHVFKRLDGAQIQFAYDHPDLARGASDGEHAAYEKLHAMIDAMAAPTLIHRDEAGLIIGAQKQVAGAQ